MTIPRSVMDDIEAILDRTLDNLSLSISSQTGEAGSPLRSQIGDVRAHFECTFAT